MTERSQRVHSTRVAPISETISRGAMPRERSPQASSSPRASSSPQVRVFQAPPARWTAAVRFASSASRLLNKPDIDWMASTASLCSFLAFSSGPAIMGASQCGSSVGALPRPLLVALVVGRILHWRLDDFLQELLRFVLAPVVGDRVGEIQLRAQVRGMALHRRREDLHGFVDFLIRPRQLVEIPAPKDDRGAVEIVRVEAHGGLGAAAELPLQPLAQGGEDADALGVEPDADGGPILAAHVVAARRYREVSRLPAGLSDGSLDLAAVGHAVRLEGKELREPPVGLEAVGILGELLAEDLADLLLRCALVAGLVELVRARHPVLLPRRRSGAFRASVLRGPLGRFRLGDRGGGEKEGCGAGWKHGPPGFRGVSRVPPRPDPVQGFAR